MSDLNVLAEPPTMDQLRARIRARISRSDAGAELDYRATRRDWSGTPSAQIYVDKVRAQRRQLVSLEVEALNDLVWDADALRFGERTGLFRLSAPAERIAA